MNGLALSGPQRKSPNREKLKPKNSLRKEPVRPPLDVLRVCPLQLKLLLLFLLFKLLLLLLQMLLQGLALQLLMLLQPVSLLLLLLL